MGKQQEKDEENIENFSFDERKEREQIIYNTKPTIRNVHIFQ